MLNIFDDTFKALFAFMFTYYLRFLTVYNDLCYFEVIVSLIKGHNPYYVVHRSSTME